MPDLRYPIGPFIPEPAFTPATRAPHIDKIAALPGQMRQAANHLTEAQLNTAYRDGGWTVRQLIHHVPDSHLNAYIRCKLALTENTPTIKPYDQDAWVQLKDSEFTPVETSLALLEAIHTRWVTLLRSLPADDFARK